MGKKVIDADFTVVSGPRPARKDLPRWFKILVFSLAGLASVGTAIERTKQADGRPSLLDRPTAQAPALPAEPGSP